MCVCVSVCVNVKITHSLTHGGGFVIQFLMHPTTFRFFPICPHHLNSRTQVMTALCFFCLCSFLFFGNYTHRPFFLLSHVPVLQIKVWHVLSSPSLQVVWSMVLWFVGGYVCEFPHLNESKTIFTSTGLASSKHMPE